MHVLFYAEPIQNVYTIGIRNVLSSTKMLQFDV